MDFSSKKDKKIGIIGLGAYLPEKVLTNKDLEKMVDTTDEWITTRTGIEERRIADKNTPTSELAKEAALSALKNAGIVAQDIELLIVATITPDMTFPSTACLVQNKIGAKKAACFDISAACAGYIYGMAIASSFIKAGLYKNALVIGAEKLSAITDWSDRNTCVLFGDGAGACVLSEVENDGILSFSLGADGGQSDLLKMPGGGTLNPATHQTVDEKLHFLKMKGNEVFKSAVKAMADAANDAVKQVKLGCKDISCVIPHQANQRIISAVAKKLGLDEQKIFMNIKKYGNMSSASTAVALYEAANEKRIKKGDIVVLDAFGSGFVWAACVIKWNL